MAKSYIPIGTNLRPDLEHQMLSGEPSFQNFVVECAFTFLTLV
jgi:hypothetical protein